MELTPRPGADRPDVVLFLTDEQRHDEVGYASGGYYETPCLDGLAARGAVFESAYSGSTVCVPARASLLTGLSHHRVPLETNTLALREGYWTIARALRAIGYETVLVGKMHFFPMYAKHGFDVMRLSEHLVPFSGYEDGAVDDYHRFLIWQGRADAAATHMFGKGHPSLATEYEGSFGAVAFPHDKSLHPVSWIAREAVRAIEGRKPGVPLFLVVSFPRPHAPYDPPEPYASLYDPAAIRLPSSGYEANEGLPESFQSAFDRSDRKRHRPHRTSDFSEPVYRKLLAYVRGMIRYVDDAMDEVMERLDPARTVAFFTSDHGTYGGHRGLLGKVPWIGFEDLARVPFVCAAPGTRARRIAAPVQSFDFVPTALDYGGIDVPEGVFDGTSLRPVLEGGEGPAERAVFSGISMGWPMIRKGSLKLVRRGKEAGPEMAFDLGRDPGETRSVLDDPEYAGRIDELRRLLDGIVARPVPLLPTVE